MLQQDFNAQQHQDHAAGQLRPLFVPGAEPAAHRHTRNGNAERGGADDAAGRQNGGIKKRESNSDCQSINAGSDSHEKKFLVVQTRADGGVLGLVLLAGESLPQHIAADEHQQDEGDPVVKALDSGRELRAQHPADKRHKRLKAAEIQPHRQSVTPSDFRHGQALTHRHRKGVHR